MRINPRLMYDIRNGFNNIRLQELHDGEIDIDFITRMSVIIPVPACPAGFRQHMTADRIDQPQILRKRYEIRR